MIHRGVGVADQVDHVVGVLGDQRDADARRHVDLLVAHVHGLRDFGRAPCRARAAAWSCSASRLAVDGFGENRELVAGQSPDDGFFRQHAREPFAERFEHAVAGLVPERVVHFLEVVDVDVQQREAAALALLRVIAWCSRCWNCMRFGILVSVSKRAR